MMTCKQCGDEFRPGEMASGGKNCLGCHRKREFAEFAKSVGLTRFPRPDGERYVYNTDLSFAGKKGECEDFMDELWNALVTVKDKPHLRTGE